jgi:alpha-acetolactate decarboxylase
MMRRLLHSFLLVAMAVGANAGENGGVTLRPPWEGVVRFYGSLGAIFHDGRIGSEVQLESLLPNPRLYAVGTLADVAGEVTIVGGTAYLSYRDGESSARIEEVDSSTEDAAILVAAWVDGWASVMTTEAIRFEELDDAIIRFAKSVGFADNARFPFLVEGELEDLHFHVIDGSRLAAGRSSHRDHLAASIRSSRDRAPATLVGFFSARDVGVITQMDSSTHIHCVVCQDLASGHVDRVTIPAGTTIRFLVNGTDD